MRLRLCVLFALVLGVWRVHAATLNVLDNFTEGADTALTNHDPDTGAGVGDWSEAEDSAGTEVIQVDSATDSVEPSNSTTSARVIMVMTPDSALGSADYDVSVTLNAFTTGQADADPLGVVARWQSAGNYYVAGLATLSNDRLFMGKRVANTYTSLAENSTPTVSAGAVLKFTLRTDTLRLYLNGSQVLCAVDAAHSSTGQAGMAWGNVSDFTAADVNVSNRLDVFTLDDATGDGGDDNCASATSPRGTLFGVLPLLVQPWRIH